MVRKLRTPQVLLAACLAVSLVGCGTAQSVAAGASGVSAPRQLTPLTLAQVGKIPEGNPASTVMRLWFWGQWGSMPNVLASYDPGTVRITGSRDIFQVYTIQRSTLLEFRPQIVDESTRGFTAFVAVQGKASGQKPYQASFDLRRVGRAWFITHDSLLEGTLPGYVTRGDALLQRIRAYAATFSAQEAQLPLQVTNP